MLGERPTLELALGTKRGPEGLSIEQGSPAEGNRVKLIEVLLELLSLEFPYRAVTRHHGDFSVMGTSSLQPFLKSYWLTPVK